MPSLTENDFDLGLNDEQLDHIESQCCGRVRECLSLRSDKCLNNSSMDSCIVVIKDRIQFLKEGNVFSAMVALTKLRQSGQDLPLVTLD